MFFLLLVIFKITVKCVMRDDQCLNNAVGVANPVLAEHQHETTAAATIQHFFNKN